MIVACGVSHLVTTGNEADVEVGDVLLHFAADPAISVLVAYVEGRAHAGPIHRGTRFGAP